MLFTAEGGSPCVSTEGQVVLKTSDGEPLFGDRGLESDEVVEQVATKVREEDVAGLQRGSVSEVDVALPQL